jgi:hypothetical protein
MKWQIVCKLAVVLPMKSSTIDLGSVKYVQDGSRNNWQCSHEQINVLGHLLTAFRSLWERCEASVDEIIGLLYGSIHNYHQENIEESVIHKKTDAYSVWDLACPSTGTLSGQNSYNECSLQ